jgi:polar amino acid transport system ATP-binding protein/sulfate transport system ATP-binding protein
MTFHPHEFKDVILHVEGVSVRYGANQILRDVNVEVRNVTRPGKTQGQVVALLGPSGVGKTTLFRVLAGLNEPDAGRVLVGVDMVPVRAGMVGVVAQHYPLFAHRTVLGNLTVAGRQAGHSAKQAEDHARQLLDRFHLLEHAGKYPTQLSGGQRQRVAIAQQFMCSEHFLLMDEPFSGLDLLAVRRVIELICEIAASDEMKTFIVVTHDIQAALMVADTLWVMGRDRDAQGQIIPGAHVVATYDLITRGLAWNQDKDIARTPEFAAMLAEIHAIYPRL